MNLSKLFLRATRLQKCNRINARRGFLERLESRTLFAVTILPGAHAAKFTDVDGDVVTVSISTGTLTLGNFTAVATGLGDQLRLIDISGPAFNNANVNVTVTKGALARLQPQFD